MLNYIILKQLAFDRVRGSFKWPDWPKCFELQGCQVIVFIFKEVFGVDSIFFVLITTTKKLPP